MKDFQRDCENGVNQWRTGMVDYPQELFVSVNESVTYNAAVDARENPLPADKVIEADNAKVGSEPIAVKCRLAAKLVEVSDGVKVSSGSESGWIHRDFTPLGVVEWSWSVTAEKPVDQELQLHLRPAVLTEGGVNSSMYSSENESTLVTRVVVRATVIERVSYWFDTQWPLLAGVAGILALAAVAFRTWILEQVTHFREWRRQQKEKVPPDADPDTDT